MSDVITVKKFDCGFTQIPNTVLVDPKLSIKAKGLYCYLLSKPDNWEFYTSIMEKELGLSFRQIRVLLQELTNYGLVVRHQINKDGSFGGVVYEFINPTDIPKTPTTQKCVDGKTVSQSNTYIESNTDNRDNNISLAGQNLTENGNTVKPKKEKDFHAEVLAEMLEIHLNNAYNRKFTTNDWYKQMELLIQHDGIEFERARDVMNWHFENLDRKYCHVILSARAFREKFLALETQMKRNQTERLF